MDDLNQIKFRTFSILPATLSQSLDICQGCQKFIVFREDLNPNFKKLKSLAKNLNADIAQQCMSEEMLILKNKFTATTIKPPTGEFLDA